MLYSLRFSQVFKYIPLLLDGLKLSVTISVIGMIIGCALGVFFAVGKRSGYAPFRMFSLGYIECIRNTPLLIQMYLLYFGLGQFGLHLSPFISAILAITLNNAAYTAVIFRTGIDAVDEGQTEAGKALGMRSPQIFRHIVFPQAFKIVVPPLTNQFISIFLFSSVASTISLPELTYQTMYIESVSMRTFEVFILATGLYLLVTTLITIGSNLYEKRLARY